MTTNGQLKSNRLDTLVQAYIDCRKKIKEIEDQHKQELEKPYRLRELLTERLLQVLADSGQEMARTQYGTVSAATRDTASCSDPNLFIDYVREHNAYELMDRRPNSIACRQFAKEYGALPPGVKLNSIRYVNVRAPTQTEDLI
jgi:hypothetical protein